MKSLIGKFDKECLLCATHSMAEHLRKTSITTSDKRFSSQRCWIKDIKPIIRLWPHDSKLLTDEIRHYFALIVFYAGKVMKEAKDSLQWALAPINDAERFLFQIDDSPILSHFPEESLALTFFSRLALKTPVFRKVFEMIFKMMVSDTSFYEHKDVMEKYLPKAIVENKEGVLNFLAAIDTGIKDIFYETIDKRKVFYTSHVGKDGKKYSINLYNESSGTLKSIIVYIIAQFVIDENGVMVVDELSAKLHPLLLKFIVDLFYNEKSKAQLIYTTHDTTLMDKKFSRRDQILFVQKDDYGYSTLSTLSDFKVRSDASFEKDYLAGVYGGIPMLKDFSMKTGE